QIQNALAGRVDNNAQVKLCSEITVMLLLRLLSDRNASVAPLLAFLAIPLLGSVGAAVDFSRAGSTRAAMQAALDSTALMLAKDSVSPDPQKGTSYFEALLTRP